MPWRVNIAISLADKSEARQNGYTERLVRTFKEKEVGLSCYQDYDCGDGPISRPNSWRTTG